MANDLIEIKADKNDLMINIKNIFLNEFLKKKMGSMTSYRVG